MNQSKDQDVQRLLKHAADGDKAARKTINTVVNPFIEFQTDKFCRRFCQNSFRDARCTLTPPQGSFRGVRSEDILCDKANASYAWMLDELTNKQRLSKIRAENTAQLGSYFKTTVNSLPFYERWKNWRFERRIHVPTYICEIDEQAKSIFLQLHSNRDTRIIAQNLGLSENTVRSTAEAILITLTQRKRLHLLNPTRTFNFSDITSTNDNDGEEGNPQTESLEISDTQFSPENLIYSSQIKSAWMQLSELEQYIIEALVIEEQDAIVVLKTLATLDISLKQNQSSQHNNRQQLYYFKRKSLEKLQGFLEGGAC